MVHILLIGMKEDDSLRKSFHRVTNIFRSCSTLEEAKQLIKDTDLFFLDSRFGLNDCTCFLKWTADHTQAIGIIVEDVMNSSICIEGINSGIVCDHIIRPITPERYTEAWESFRGKFFDHQMQTTERIRRDRDNEGRKECGYEEL